jgi:hypothetical protein
MDGWMDGWMDDICHPTRPGEQLRTSVSGHWQEQMRCSTERAGATVMDGGVGMGWKEPHSPAVDTGTPKSPSLLFESFPPLTPPGR